MMHKSLQKLFYVEYNIFIGEKSIEIRIFLLYNVINILGVIDMDYILVFIAVLLLAFTFVLQKFYQTGVGSGAAVSMLFTALRGLLGAAFLFCIGGFTMELTPYSLLMAFLYAMLVLVYTLISFRMLEGGMMASYTMFLMAGGMTVPYFWGILFLNEASTVWRFIGLALLLAGVVYSNLKGEKIKKSLLLMGVLVFVLNGFVSTVSKLHQTEARYSVISSNSFAILCSIIQFAVSIIAFAVLAGKSKGVMKGFPYKKMIPLVALIAALSAVSQLFQLIGAKTIDAAALYPIITGGTIVFSSVGALIFFKEKVNRSFVLGIVLCVIGTCMFLI
jgi:drug/metabolite transporter (DMT)-like permease